MTKTKKFNILLFAIVLALTSLLFVACGKLDYSNVSLSADKQYIEMFVGDERNVTITIDNPVGGMSKFITNSPSEICSVREIAQNGFATTFTISGEKGGKTSIVFTAVDGGASTTIDVLVRKYGDEFSAKDGILALTEQNQIVPSVLDFNINDSQGDQVSETDLEYYFVGEYKANASLNDVKYEEQYVREFVSVKLHQEEGSDELFLTFTDKNNQRYAVNKTNEFVLIDADFVFNSDSHLTVNSGDKFTFVARYQTDLAEFGACKHFIIHEAISQASHTVQYKDQNAEAVFTKASGNLSGAVTVDGKPGVVTFIPYYTPNINGKIVDFLTAYVVVTMPEFNSNIKVKAYSENANVVTYKSLGVSDDDKVYCYQLSCAHGEKSETNFVVQFYYEGFEDSNDSTVNCRYEIPVEIRNIPETLFVNGLDIADESFPVLQFFNHHEGEHGKQAFNFEIKPSNAEYSYFGIDLTDSDLVVEYKGTPYTADDLSDTEGVLYISDITETLYIRGKEGASAKENGQLKIIAGINILTETQQEYILPYTIVNGAKYIEFADDYFAKNGLYLDLFGGEVTLKNQIKVLDKDRNLTTYQSFTISHVEGKSIAQVVAGEASENYINLKFNPLRDGLNDFYRITLDNGVTFDFKVNVIETLNSIEVQSSNENNLINHRDENVYYIYNRDKEGNITNKTLDFKVVANGNENSTAISNVDIALPNSDVFSIYAQSENGVEFDLKVLQDGQLDGLKITANGDIVVNFKSHSYKIEKELTLYSYSYIDGITTKQIIQGEGGEETVDANYVKVYSNIKSADLRTVTFSVDVAGDGFMFYNVNDAVYQPTAYENEYIYWEVDDEIVCYKGSDNNQLALSVGTLILDEETHRLTFIANQDLNNKKEFYLLTHIRQWGRVFTYTTKITIEKYTPVDSISLQEGIEAINLSILKKSNSLVAIPVIASASGQQATNPRIQAQLVTEVELLKGLIYNPAYLTVDAKFDEGTSKTNVIITITDEFVGEIAGKTEELTAVLEIYATDWLEGGAVAPDYKIEVLKINVRFENGTEVNRLTLENAQDLLAIKSNLSAHYQINNIIDASSKLTEMPFGTLTGSIVGIKDYAKITGLNFTDGDKTGLFESIANQAYIKNLSFEGSFNWDKSPTTANIGLIAGENNGLIENVGVVINKSAITLASQNFGGIVGVNNKDITQNFTKYDEKIDDPVNPGNKIDNPDYSLYQNCSPKTLVFYADAMNIVANNTGVNANIGGVAGKNSGKIAKTASDVKYYGYTNYTAYSDIVVTVDNNNARMRLGGVAGEHTGELSGILAGGRVSGYGEIGGVAGKSTGKLISIITRTFVRSYTGAVALVANVVSLANPNDVADLTIEAVDDGRFGREASMGIAYAPDDFTNNYDDNGNYAFGNDTGVSLSADKLTLRSYVLRTQIGTRGAVVNDALELTQYYGDFIIISENKLLADPYNFEKATTTMNVSAKFDNAMTPSGADDTKVFYTYYFGVKSLVVDGGGELEKWQEDFDLALNNLSADDIFYPIKSTLTDVYFTSESPDILSFERSGNIVVKGTGLVHIYATSLLNSNNGLDFYIYVVNYFDRDQAKSIIYPNTSASSVPIDNTIITLRADNTAKLYIRPDYTFDEEDITISRDGVGRYQGILFNLDESQQVSATVDALEDLKITISGQEISLQRKDHTIADATYAITIQPILNCELHGEAFTANVNKKISQTSVDYKRGAISIVNKSYDQKGISTSLDIYDTLVVTSTADVEEKPLYRIYGLNGDVIQGTVGEDPTDGLFIVEYDQDKSELSDPINGFYKHEFGLSIKVNQGSDAFKNRYTNNIYGTYTFVAYAASNNQKSVSFTIALGKTNIISVPIDNYTKLSEATGSLPSKSEKAYPGESGLLAIYVTPVDADYDSIIIENDAVNYTQGHANATFALLARKESVVASENLFASEYISGSQTASGLVLRLDDIIAIYHKDGYVDYNGVIYVRYDFSSENVVDESLSQINVKFMKDGQAQPLKTAEKELVVKLQHYVGIELVGKDKNHENNAYFSAYTVATGLKYEINIKTYGFAKEDVKLTTSNENLGKIVQENGKYYLEIQSAVLQSGLNSFDIYVEGVNAERSATSMTKITVQDFVLNYNNDVENARKPDIVEGMSGGIINIQIGTQMDFALNLYDYFEYDSTNSEVVNKIKTFLSQLTAKANWTALTNLETDERPDHLKKAGEGIKYVNLENANYKNYYFHSEKLKVMPVHTHKTTEDGYYFTVEAFYKASGTNYQVCTASTTDARKIATEFKFNVYMSSSEESPIPVYNMEEFSSMYMGSHYILMNDLTLPADYKPQIANFASLDGNGCTIHFKGGYNFGNSEQLGVFSDVETDTIIKNLNINFMVSASIVSFETTAESYTFGALAANNNGKITNCHVYSAVWSNNDAGSVAGSAIDDNGQTDFTIKAVNAGTNRNYIGGLIGYNNGYITNSSVMLDVKSTATIGGLVAVNNGKIAASAFKGGTLTGEGTLQNTAGFVYQNGENGQIVTSYVSGGKAQKYTDADGREKMKIYTDGAIILSSQPSGGFAFLNEGSISDCYSDVGMESVSARNAGFVYTNHGKIKNAFSLSIIKSNNTSSAGFAMEHSGVNAALTNCFYYFNNTASPKINSALAQVDKTFGITKLNDEGFKNLSNFAEFSHSSYISTRSVWFFVEEGINNSNDFIEGRLTFKSGAENEFVTEYTYNTNKTLIQNRLDLVSANIFTLSKRDLDEANIETDEETGDKVYHYLDSFGAPNRGSINNPLLVSTAQQMENLFLESATSAKINTQNFRLISDIDYSAENGGLEGYSNLYAITFAGILEGNGMAINNVGLVSMEQKINAGLFAQIGLSASKTGSVKNLTISPREVAFANTNSVGTLAGALNYGYINDIHVELTDEANKTVTGLNFVGGLVGRAINSFEIKNVSSNINATAHANPKSYKAYADQYVDYTKYSYAGAIAGYVGNGEVYNAYVNGVTSVMGGRAGFAYGGIGKNADVNYTYVTLPSNPTIKAYEYGGLIVGDVWGKLRYSYANGSTSNDSLIFAVLPSTPIAVGGIAGKLSGGKIENAVVNQGFKFVNDDSGNTIDNIGGIVGMVESERSVRSFIYDSIVYGDIKSCTHLGGAVGKVMSPLALDGVAVKSAKLEIYGQIVDPKLGGIISYIDDRAGAVSIANSYSTPQLFMDAYTSGLESSARMSGFVARSNSSLTMRSCYTTCKMDAKVYDIRKVEDLEPYENKGKEADQSNCLNRVNFTQNVVNNDKFVDVYYLGSNSYVDDVVTYESSTKSYIPFQAKAKSANIHLIVDQYGISSTSYRSQSENAFYGLFASDYDYYADGKHFTLRYDHENGLYEALDDLRLYIRDNGYRYNAVEYNTTINAYIKKSNVSSSPISQIEVQDIYDTGLKYEATDVGRGVIYFVKQGNGFEHVLVAKNADDVLQLIQNSKTYTCNGSQFVYVDGADKEVFNLANLYKFEFLQINANPLPQLDEYAYDFDVNVASQLNIKLPVGVSEYDEGWYCTETVNTENWVAMSLYQDVNKNVYKAQKDNDGATVFVNILDDDDTKSIDKLSLIWNADATAKRLTHLCFEDNLGWLNKK